MRYSLRCPSQPRTMPVDDLPPPPPTFGASPPARGAGLGAYLKAAFKWKWNLLALAGGMVAAYISGKPDVFVPLLIAGEMAYLAGLTSIPKFRAYVDRQQSPSNRQAAGNAPAVNPDEQVVAILRELAPGLRNRFIALRDRCLTMQRLAAGVGGPGSNRGEDLSGRTEGLDKMLWVFLRLLYSQQGMWRFLEATNAEDLEKQLKKLEERRAALGATPDERLLKSLTDSIATATLRLDNVRNARNNSEFVELELERIEGKIMALSEMAVNNQNPDYISTQVDAVADSMAATESALKEFDYLSGLSRDVASTPPRILAAQTSR